MLVVNGSCKMAKYKDFFTVTSEGTGTNCIPGSFSLFHIFTIFMFCHSAATRPTQVNHSCVEKCK